MSWIKLQLSYWKVGIEPIGYSISLAILLLLGVVGICKLGGTGCDTFVRDVFIYVGIVLLLLVLPYVVGRYIKGWTD